MTTDVTVLIPMAGIGARFVSEGYTVPKPLIPVLGKPMIENVIENLNIQGKYVFIIQAIHETEHGLGTLLKKIQPECEVVTVNGTTQGPACSALLAQQYISDKPLIITNCDQVIKDFSIEHLLEFSNINNADGVLGAFISTSNKNSYIKLDEKGQAVNVKEKIVISNTASNGFHFWRSGADFIRSANKMIANNERYNNEFYIAPSYNYLIEEGKKILPFFYNLHFPIGVPSDLINYTNLYGSSKV